MGCGSPAASASASASPARSTTTPDVLILDEATSALDNLTKKAVMDAVHNLGQAKTIIMIAHRLSTVRDCNSIIMIERGQIVAQGPYADLLGKNAKFRAMAGAASH